MLERILLGVDGSDDAKKAIVAAAEVARAVPQSEVVVCHVMEIQVPTGRSLSEVPLEEPGEASELVDSVVAQLQGDGINARGKVRRGAAGNVAKELIEEAASSGAGLIVLGSRGLSDFASLLVGSVAHKVLQHGTCSVLVVR